MKTQAKGNRRTARPTRSRPAPARRKSKPAPARRPVRPAPRMARVKPPPPDPAIVAAQLKEQRQSYDEAVRLFQAKKYDRAEAPFQKSAGGPNRTLAHHAQVHLEICRQRLRPAEVTLKTADDHYNYAVSLINARRLEEAAGYLRKALGMSPKADHVHYALASAQALQGNAAGAYESLKTAVALEPRNRYLARSDGDFAGVLGYPPLASLLHLDRGGLPRSS